MTFSSSLQMSSFYQILNFLSFASVLIPITCIIWEVIWGLVNPQFWNYFGPMIILDKSLSSYYRLCFSQWNVESWEIHPAFDSSKNSKHFLSYASSTMKVNLYQTLSLSERSDSKLKQTCKIKQTTRINGPKMQ